MHSTIYETYWKIAKENKGMIVEGPTFYSTMIVRRRRSFTSKEKLHFAKLLAELDIEPDACVAWAARDVPSTSAEIASFNRKISMALAEVKAFDPLSSAWFWKGVSALLWPGPIRLRCSSLFHESFFFLGWLRTLPATKVLASTQKAKRYKRTFLSTAGSPQSARVALKIRKPLSCFLSFSISVFCFPIAAWAVAIEGSRHRVWFFRSGHGMIRSRSEVDIASLRTC